MELAYEKLMREHNLKLEDLPADAQICITGIKNIQTAMGLVEAKGKTVKPATISKLQANDKWAVREILDYIENKDTNTPAPPNDPAKVVQEVKSEEGGEPGAAPGTQSSDNGVKIEAELTALGKGEKRNFTMAELKSAAPVAYADIYKTYAAGEENGVETTRFSLIEDKATPETFILTVK